MSKGPSVLLTKALLWRSPVVGDESVDLERDWLMAGYPFVGWMKMAIVSVFLWQKIFPKERIQPPEADLGFSVVQGSFDHACFLVLFALASLSPILSPTLRVYFHVQAPTQDRQVFFEGLCQSCTGGRVQARIGHSVSLRPTHQLDG